MNGPITIKFLKKKVVECFAKVKCGKPKHEQATIKRLKEEGRGN